MKLYEFFGNIERDPNKDDKAPDNLKNEKQQELINNLFWFIIDDDKLHKEYFMPAASEIYKAHKAKKLDCVHDWKTWMPMVKQGCIEFYKEHRMEEDPAELFNKELRIDMCKQLADHYHKDIISGEYNLGH